MYIYKVFQYLCSPVHVRVCVRAVLPHTQQCGGQSGSSADEDSETLPSIISHTPSPPMPPKPHPQESDTLSTQAQSPEHKPLKIHESVITDRKCSTETAAEPAESEARVSSASKVFSERDSDSAEGEKAVESVGEVEKTEGEGGKVLSDTSSCEEGDVNPSDSDSDFEGFRPIRDLGRMGDKKKEIQIKIRGLEPDKKEQPSLVAATRQESDVKTELEPEATHKTAVDGKSASKTQRGETEGEERGREGRRERGRGSSRDNRKKKKKHKKHSKRDGRRSHHSSSRSPSRSRSRSGSRSHSRSHSR